MVNGIIAWVGLLVSLSAAPLSAQENFYGGKTLRLVVGFSAGGGFDVYSRAISRHITGKLTQGWQGICLPKLISGYSSRFPAQVKDTLFNRPPESQ
jgi:hypothetical protein